MARRIEIELTSSRDDGTWTWRVVGAKQPKGVLDGGLLPAGSKVGDVMRADAEFELDGAVITAVVAPPAKHTPTNLVPLLGDGKPFEGVTTTLFTKGGGDRGPRGDRGDRREGRGPRRADGPGRGDSGPRTDRPPRGDSPRSEGTGRPDRPPRVERPPRPDRPERAERSEQPDGASAERAPRSDGPPRGPRQGRSDGPRPGGRPGREGAPARDSGPPKPKRLNPASVHRTQVLEALAPEQRVVAEQVLQGGVPALRRALQEQNTRARGEGRPEIKADALIQLAEELLPRLKAAEWRDRAEAAAPDMAEIALRDLRSVVAGADAGARDDDARILAKTLREELDRRETAERGAWVAEVTTCLDEGRVTRALRVSGRPPDPRTRLAAELAARLTEAASAAMSPETPGDRWAQLLEALLESPVRRAVKPMGLPAQPSDALMTAARQAAGRVPALASLVGLSMPPPPGPPRGGRRPTPPPPRRPTPPRPSAPVSPAAVSSESADPIDVTAPAAVDAIAPIEAPVVPTETVGIQAPVAPAEPAEPEATPLAESSPLVILDEPAPTPIGDAFLADTDGVLADGAPLEPAAE